MICPKCNEEGAVVVDSRQPRTLPYRRRRYQCPCGWRYTTHEITADEHARLREAAESVKFFIGYVERSLKSHPAGDLHDARP